MAFTIPYNKLTLQIASMGLNSKLDEKKMNEFMQASGAEFTTELTKAEINKTVAKLNGITVIDLINSPNYATLIEEYSDQRTNTFMKKMKEEFDLDDKEAYALVAQISGLLD